MILDVLTYPNPILRQKSEKVQKMTDDVRKFCNDLAETMLVRDGVGLAAIQVGQPLQIFVLNDNGPKFFINPVIYLGEKRETEMEGCLSFPGVFAKVDRAVEAEVTALDLNFMQFGMKATGLMAKALQHEDDHLQAVLLVDRLSHLKREMVLKKYNKQRK